MANVLIVTNHVLLALKVLIAALTALLAMPLMKMRYANNYPQVDHQNVDLDALTAIMMVLATKF